MKESAKVYVTVNVEFSEQGVMLPRSIVWEDGAEYGIDRVKDIRTAHSTKAGGQGDRYTIIVGGREKYLFFEHNPSLGGYNLGRWFMERRG